MRIVRRVIIGILANTEDVDRDQCPEQHERQESPGGSVRIHGGEQDLEDDREHDGGDNSRDGMVLLLMLTHVELRGLEPLTPCMPCRCATSCATAPYWEAKAYLDGLSG